MNDFSQDPTCQAWWRCNQADLLADALGNNHLTGHGDPDPETSAYKEGNACLRLQRSLSQYATIADGDLTEGFPLKYGDQNKTLAACFWLQSADAADQTLLCKADESKTTFLVGIQQGQLSLQWGYRDGLQQETYPTQFRVIPGQWYHLYVALNGLRRQLVCRLYHDRLRSWQTCSFRPHNELWVGDGDWYLGGDPDGRYYNGLLDEILIFNAFKTAKTQLHIIQGLHGSPTPKPASLPPIPHPSGWRWNQSYWR